MKLEKLGFNGHRLAVSPFEKVALEMFLKEIDFDSYGTKNLHQYIFARSHPMFMGDGSFTNRDNHPEIKKTKLSKREEKIIFSIIQFLGSPNGRCFTENLRNEISKKAKELQDAEKERVRKQIEDLTK